MASGLDDFEYRVRQNYGLVVGDNIELWVIDDAWHVGGTGAIPEEYSRRMLAFFEIVPGN